MMNHKLVFREYGVRRPLKMRRRIARRSRVLWRKFGSRVKDTNGHHSRWWSMGQFELLMAERRLARGET